MNESSAQSDSLQGRIDEIARKAEEIYEEKYKEEYERDHSGSYVVINLKNEDATVHEFSEEAVKAAREKDPYGLFHLMRIGPSPTLSMIR